MQTKTLDLGCGIQPKNPFSAEQVFGIDIRESADGSIRCADLAVEPIPFPDGHFQFVTAFDLIEHIPRVLYLPQRRNCFVELMNEVHRVLAPGGIFYSSTPAYPHAAAFIDPTHVNIIAEGTFSLYFANGAPDGPWGVIYGFKGYFELMQEQWSGPHLQTMLRKADRPSPAAAQPA